MSIVVHDIKKIYEAVGVLPERKKVDNKIRIFGFEVNSGVGIPSGILRDSKWTHLGFKAGADICHYTIEGAPKDLEHLKEDIKIAHSQAQEGQLLVVSVAGESVEDFVKTALLAKECGAKIIEANLSTGSLYLNQQAVGNVSRAMVEALGNTPLILKVGAFPNKDHLEKILKIAAKAGISGVSGIIEDAGKEAALNFARDAREINSRFGLSLTLIGGGGITQSDHFAEFFKHTRFAMCGSGWMNDPAIFLKWHNRTLSKL